MPPAIVVDTMIASAGLDARESSRQRRWRRLLSASPWVLPFAVVAEMRFGAEVARWGARRRIVLDRLVASSAVVPPIGDVTDAYVQLRTWCVRAGHGLGGKDHEADRWVAAVSSPLSFRWRQRRAPSIGSMDPFGRLHRSERLCGRRGQSGPTTQVYEGTNQVQRVVIARNLLRG